MEKEFATYEQALALKELGFDESTYTWRQHGNGISGNVEGKRDYYNRKGDVYVALPTYSQAFRWFREKYKLHQVVLADEKGKYDIIVGERISGSCLGQYETYEEAELECLKKLIEIVKEQK